MYRAIWQNTVLAESDNCQSVEGNLYFPPDTINNEFFRHSATQTTCGWKGQASYFDIVVGDQVNYDAAWYYPDPKEGASHIKDHIAFWKGVDVQVIDDI